MKFCPNCGSPLEEGAVTCPNCGDPLTQNAEPAPAPYVDPMDHTGEFDAADISENKVIAMLPYILGIAGLIIALLARSDSPYAASASLSCWSSASSPSSRSARAWQRSPPSWENWAS